MAQNPIPGYTAKNAAGALSPMTLGSTSELLTGGGTSVTKNVAAVAVVKSGPGRLYAVINNAGTAGFTLNDLATTSGGAAANQLHVISATSVGQIFTYGPGGVPFSTGLAVTALGASGNLVIVYS